MTSSELEIVVLVPMFQAKIRKGRCVGEFQVRKVPVQYLTILRRQVNVAAIVRIVYEWGYDSRIRG